LGREKPAENGNKVFLMGDYHREDMEILMLSSRKFGAGDPAWIRNLR